MNVWLFECVQQTEGVYINWKNTELCFSKSKISWLQHSVRKNTSHHSHRWCAIHIIDIVIFSNQKKKLSNIYLGLVRRPIGISLFVFFVLKFKQSKTSMILSFNHCDAKFNLSNNLQAQRMFPFFCFSFSIILSSWREFRIPTEHVNDSNKHLSFIFRQIV